MRIGIVPSLDRSWGGVCQYSSSMLRELGDWKSQECDDEFVVFADDLNDPALLSFNKYGWVIKPLHPTTLKTQAINGIVRSIGHGAHRTALRWIKRNLKVKFPRPD